MCPPPNPAHHGRASVSLPRASQRSKAGWEWRWQAWWCGWLPPKLGMPLAGGQPAPGKPGHRITEPQNVRAWKGPLWVTQSNPLPKQGHPEPAAQDCVQAGLEYLQRRRLHSLPGQPVPVLHHPQREVATSPQLAQEWGFPRPLQPKGEAALWPIPTPGISLLLSNGPDKGSGARGQPWPLAPNEVGCTGATQQTPTVGQEPVTSRGKVVALERGRHGEPTGLGTAWRGGWQGTEDIPLLMGTQCHSAAGPGGPRGSCLRSSWALTFPCPLLSLRWGWAAGTQHSRAWS